MVARKCITIVLIAAVLFAAVVPSGATDVCAEVSMGFTDSGCTKGKSETGKAPCGKCSAKDGMKFECDTANSRFTLKGDCNADCSVCGVSITFEQGVCTSAASVGMDGYVNFKGFTSDCVEYGKMCAVLKNGYGNSGCSTGTPTVNKPPCQSCFEGMKFGCSLDLLTFTAGCNADCSQCTSQAIDFPKDECKAVSGYPG